MSGRIAKARRDGGADRQGRFSRFGGLVRRMVAIQLEAFRLAWDAIRVFKLRSTLAISGIVIGIITVVVIASILVNLRNQVALLFRELGTENVFAFHLTGDPYAEASEAERNRRPLRPEFAEPLARLGDAIREVAVQVIIPPLVGDEPIVVRAARRETESALVEAVSANYFRVVGAEFRDGRPFTDLEERRGARVAVLGAGISEALFGDADPVGRPILLAGERYLVVGRLAKRKGGFFGENRQDNVVAIPQTAARRRFPEADRTVLYIRSEPGRLQAAYNQAEWILRRLRGLRPDEPNDFSLSTAESIIRNLDQVSAGVGLITFALAGVSLFIGGIGIANIMLISVTERTREIGTRLAVGARRREVLAQFLIEAAGLSLIGGVIGVGLAVALGLLLGLVLEGYSAEPPLWAVLAGVGAALGVGIIAGYWPARRAAAMDPVEALRYE
ncbi:MAG: ABC transporter permease [Acidobacteriota bacterium]